MAFLPLCRPIAGLTTQFIGAVIVSEEEHVVGCRIGIVTLDVCEIEEDLVVLTAVVPDLFVPDVHIAALAATVQVAGHVDKFYIRVVLFEIAHQVEIGVNVCLGAVDLAAPRPHDDIDIRIGVKICPCP